MSNDTLHKVISNFLGSFHGGVLLSPDQSHAAACKAKHGVLYFEFYFSVSTSLYICISSFGIDKPESQNNSISINSHINHDNLKIKKRGKYFKNI